MFPFFNQQCGAYYQQQLFPNQYWPTTSQQQEFLLHGPVPPQYCPNVYLNYNIYPEISNTNQNTPNSLPTFEVPTKEKKTFSCNCVNTDCRKEYCICFKNGEICGDKCGCSSCRNKQQCQRNFALQKKKSLVCNCKKSQCAKKYCECYANGIRCGDGCHCQDCKNN